MVDTIKFLLQILNLIIFFFQPLRQMKLNNELNNMSWRVRPDEVLLEVGRLYGSKMGLQKLNVEVYRLLQKIINFYLLNVES